MVQFKYCTWIVLYYVLEDRVNNLICTREVGDNIDAEELVCPDMFMRRMFRGRVYYRSLLKFVLIKLSVALFCSDPQQWCRFCTVPLKVVIMLMTTFKIHSCESSKLSCSGKIPFVEWKSFGVDMCLVLEVSTWSLPWLLSYNLTAYVDC